MAAAVFCGATAHAADMAVKAPPAVSTPTWNWTGWYAGMNAGYAWSASTDPGISLSDTSGTGYAGYVAAGGFPTASLKPAGGFGGAQIGYNFQNAKWVWGAEADLQGAGIDASSNQTAAPTAVIGSDTVTHELQWFGTVRGRLGMASDNWLFYGTGGLIYGGVRSALTQAATNGYLAASNHTEIRAGGTAGAGVETGWNKWTAKLEYLYYDMGRDTVTVLGSGVFTGISYSASQRTAGQLLRVGLNYRF